MSAVQLRRRKNVTSQPNQVPSEYEDCHDDVNAKLDPTRQVQQQPSSSLLYRVCIVTQFVIIVLLLLNKHRNGVVRLDRTSYTAAGTTTKQNDGPQQRSSPVAEPLVYDCVVLIYAYDRPRHLLNILRDVARESESANLNVHVIVVDDNSHACQFAPVNRNIYRTDVRNSNPEVISNADVSDLVQIPLPTSLPCSAAGRFRLVHDYLKKKGWDLFISKYRHGRRRYWYLVRQAHTLLKGYKSRFYLFLPDDDRLAHNFFSSVLAKWDSIEDDRKLTLMLHVEATREKTSVWTDLAPQPVGQGVSRIGWVESGNFLCTTAFLEFMDWSFPSIHVSRWINNPPISSGVGSTLSELIHRSGKRMYRTDKSFVAHVGVTHSKMNARFRNGNEPTLLTKYFADGDAAYDVLLEEAATVTASIASHWRRHVSLHSAVNTLATQVDHINVYLNDYHFTPVYLLVPDISVLHSNAESAAGDLGDRGKFFWHNNISTEFHITADDDIIYPDDYVDRLLSFYHTFQSPVIVGVHGIRINETILRADTKPKRGYYASREVWMATEAVKTATPVHVVGTGTMFYRPSDIGELIIERDFPEPNMADVWIGVLAQRKGIPVVVVPRDNAWLVEVPGTFDDSIYKRSTRSRHSDKKQTEAVLSLPKWQLHEPKRQ